MEDKQNKKSQNGYVGAPFNFVPFYKNVVPVEKEKMDVRGSLKKEQYTGEISYTLTAQTPICIDDGHGNFFKNEYNEVAIPGSSMRGLIRNNAQILGLSSFDDDIDDYTLMYRDVTGGVDKDFYNGILNAGIAQVDDGKFSILKNVSAGYIANEKGKYYIYKTDVDSLGDSFVNMNYYIISARKILKNLNQYPFFQENPNCLMYKLDCEFVRVIKFEGKDADGKTKKFRYEIENDPEGLKKGEIFYYREKVNNNNKINEINIEEFSDKPIGQWQKVVCSKNPIVHYFPKNRKKGENDNYIPFFEKVLYKINGRFVDSIKEYDEYNAKNNSGYLEGYLVGTGVMKEKKALYIIPKINEQKDKIEIQEQDIKAYQVDYKKRENTLVSRVNNSDLKKKLSLKIKKFFSLPEEGERKPIFYIDPDKAYNINRLYFGYTPRLRLFYSHSVKEGYHQNIVTYDYVRSIFGTTESNKNMSRQGREENEKEIRKAYRSKVSFTDVVLQGKHQYLGTYNLILGEPKPSSFYDYIKQQGEVTTYNNDNFELRGVKQYWLANYKENFQNSTGKNKEVQSVFKALKEKSEFIGVVRFQNLSEAELGLLLWSIRLQDDSCMNIGKAKSYGFGVISVSDIKVKVVDLEKAYSLDTSLSLNPFIEKDVDELIDIYKDEINKKLNGKNIEQLEHIKDFFAMKNYEHLPCERAISFMSINDDRKENDYKTRQNTRVPLATIQQVLSNQQAEPVKKKSKSKSSNNSVFQEWNFGFREPARKERVQLENDHIYIARISKYQGKKVFFQVDKDYYNTSINNIRNVQNLTKKTMKELLPVNSKWNIKKHMEGEQTIWEFEAK